MTGTLSNPWVLASLVLLIMGLSPTVIGMVHHEVRASQAVDTPSPMRDATRTRSLQIVGAAIAFDAVLGATGLLVLTGAWRFGHGWLVYACILAAAAYGAVLIPYAFASLSEVADPASFVRERAAGAESIELHYLRHRARYRPNVLRTTLVVRRNGVAEPLLWAERADQRTLGTSSPDPRLHALAKELSDTLRVPITVVDEDRSLAWGLGPK